MEEQQTSRPPPWHALDAKGALAEVASTPVGLDDGEAAIRRIRYGANELPKAPPTGLWLIYFRQFASPLIYLLVAASVVSLALGKYTDSAFIFAVLQLNAIIGTLQEWRAETGLRGLDRLIRSWTVVTRNGRRQRIESRELVPGDIVIAEQGMKISADIRLLGSSSLRVDESLLTGESYPAEKDASAVLPAIAPLGDRRTMLYAGTSIVGGEGHGVVVSTGSATEIGRIAASLAVRRSDPPLILRLRRFLNRLTIAFSVAVTVIIMIELARGTALQDIFLVAIALAVSAVPEGLPVAITVALAIGTSRMAAKKVIVRRLPAVEGLGACTVIASDKTGTLTCNELTATRIWIPCDGEYEITGVGYRTEGVLLIDGSPPDTAQSGSLTTLTSAAILCSEGGFHIVDGKTSHYGDSVDVAFLVLSRKTGIDPDAVRAVHPRLGLIPFSPEHRYAASFNLSGTQVTANVKGAVEVILPMCAGADREAIMAEERHLAAQGIRVLAIAGGRLDAVPGSLPVSEDELCGLQFLGLVGFTDPLRPEAADAIAQCRSAGIEVRIVTGDHPVTAVAIARELGLFGPGEPQAGAVVTGAEITRCGDDLPKLERLCADAIVFARVEPAQKLMIVKALQAKGHFVAVTGDGVNDAPALKAADIGVAMGLSGTDVARDASDLVISDDRFASIVSGVREGRIVYDNVRKVVNLLITTGTAEIVLFILAMAFGMPLPLFAVQLLWLNLVTNGIQDVALAFERGEPDTLERPPRPPNQRLMDGPMLAQVAIGGAYMGIAAFAFYAIALAQGLPEDDARNLVLLLMVLFENVYIFNCRSETRSAFAVPLSANPFVVISASAALGIHIIVMHVPFMQDVLGVRPVAAADWILIGAIALGLLAVMEIYKALRRHRE